MAHKKFTQFIFDDLKDPYNKKDYGKLGHMYKLFAEITRIRRQERRMTQHQLAEKSGIAQPTLATIEAGRSNPTLSQLVKIAEALNCKLVLEDLEHPKKHTITN
jgi:DNA-binding XRE family transcriptional regulator